MDIISFYFVFCGFPLLKVYFPGCDVERVDDLIRVSMGTGRRQYKLHCALGCEWRHKLNGQKLETWLIFIFSFCTKQNKKNEYEQRAHACNAWSVNEKY